MVDLVLRVYGNRLNTSRKNKIHYTIFSSTTSLEADSFLSHFSLHLLNVYSSEFCIFLNPDYSLIIG